MTMTDQQIAALETWATKRGRLHPEMCRTILALIASVRALTRERDEASVMRSMQVSEAARSSTAASELAKPARFPELKREDPRPSPTASARTICRLDAARRAARRAGRR